jgi:hypothetical protein
VQVAPFSNTCWHPSGTGWISETCRAVAPSPLPAGGLITATATPPLARSFHGRVCGRLSLRPFTSSSRRCCLGPWTIEPSVEPPRHWPMRFLTGTSPQRTPHVVVQQLLAPGARRVVSLTLEEGRYWIRALGQPGTQLLRVAPDGRAEATAVAMSDGWAPGETVLAPTATLGLENRTNREQLLLIERLAWTDQAATAAEVIVVIVLQAFRDLFSREVLRAGERIAVGQVTLVFTDLRGSTRLYREVADAPAFGHVMNHFDVIREAVAEEGGGIVKTMGTR